MSDFKQRLSVLIPDSVAEKVIEVYGSPRNLFSATEGELRAKGVPKGSARRLAAVGELARDWGAERLQPGARFRSGADIFMHYHTKLRDLKVEQFWTVLLDGKNRVMGEVMTSQGSLTASLVHPREVFAPAIKQSAGAIVFIHNHPSGDPTPSVEDVEITRRLNEHASPREHSPCTGLTTRKALRCIFNGYNVCAIGRRNRRTTAVNRSRQRGPLPRMAGRCGDS